MCEVIKKWLYKVGLVYHSPHKFRHSHAVYAIKLAKDIAALKAVSQNLMHSNLSITDGVYGILSNNDVGEQIAALGKSSVLGEIKDIDLLIYLAKRLVRDYDEKLRIG